MGTWCMDTDVNVHRVHRGTSVIQGQGLFAKRAFCKGETILEEQPLWMATDMELTKRVYGVQCCSRIWVITQKMLYYHCSERLATARTPILIPIPSTTSTTTATIPAATSLNTAASVSASASSASATTSAIPNETNTLMCTKAAGRLAAAWPVTTDKAALQWNDQDRIMCTTLAREHGLTAGMIRDRYAEVIARNICIMSHDDRRARHADGWYMDLGMINHSCRPNAHIETIDWETGLMRLVALAPIRAAEEITWSYMQFAPNVNREERREKLRRALGFDCQCAWCTQLRIDFDTALFL